MTPSRSLWRHCNELSMTPIFRQDQFCAQRYMHTMYVPRFKLFTWFGGVLVLFHSWYLLFLNDMKVLHIYIYLYFLLCYFCYLTRLAPVPLSLFRSNSKFDENSERSSFKYTRLITTIFCTRHDSDTVVTCAKYRCDRPLIFYTRVFWIFIEFRIRSKYA